MLIFVIIREQWTDELFFFYCTENFEGWPSWSAHICRLLPRLDFLTLLFHFRNQNIKFFLTFFPCSSVNVFGNSLAVHARRESALVEMVIYDGDASRCPCTAQIYYRPQAFLPSGTPTWFSWWTMAPSLNRAPIRSFWRKKAFTRISITAGSPTGIFDFILGALQYRRGG